MAMPTTRDRVGLTPLWNFSLGISLFPNSVITHHHTRGESDVYDGHRWVCVHKVWSRWQNAAILVAEPRRCKRFGATCSQAGGQGRRNLLWYTCDKLQTKAYLQVNIRSGTCSLLCLREWFKVPNPLQPLHRSEIALRSWNMFLCFPHHSCPLGRSLGLQQVWGMVEIQASVPCQVQSDQHSGSGDQAGLSRHSSLCTAPETFLWMCLSDIPPYLRLSSSFSLVPFTSLFLIFGLLLCFLTNAPRNVGW